MRHVYLIQRGDLFKIGNSHDPEARCHAVTAGEGAVLHYFPSADAFAVERALHHRFADRLVKGIGRRREWFRLTADEVEAFRLVCGADTPADLPEGLRPPTRTPARTVKVDRELLRKARVVAYSQGRTLFDFLDSILRPALLRRQAEMVREIQEKQSSAHTL